MNQTPDQLTDLLIERIKKNAPTSDLSKERSTVNLLKSLNSIPRSEVPTANYDRVKNQILDRISIPTEEPITQNSWFSSLNLLQTKQKKLTFKSSLPITA
jgi:hypothetical protein